MIVLAVATWRSGFYPRLAYWLLVVNVVVSGLGASVPAVADAVRMPAPSYLLMALLGLTMRQAAAHPRAVSSAPVESTTIPAL